GTVTRLTFRVKPSGVTLLSATQIASGYLIRTDPAALVIGPTGLAYDWQTGKLYVASTGDNAIFSIPNAATRKTDDGMGSLVYQDDAHLRGPLGLVLAPNGDLITTNGDAVNGDPNFPSEMVEFTPSGTFVAQTPVNSTGQGGAFGLTLVGSDDYMLLIAVDDIANALNIWSVVLPDSR
ncbi:MAG TPA: hypothetical protein VKU00_03160, partial [Chthonomonadaceae bacterium]|nr:hypothetical protein [Chthonomonadaceae bacterium]